MRFGRVWGCDWHSVIACWYAKFSFNSSLSQSLNDALPIMTKDYNRLKAMMNDDFSEDIEKS